MFCVDFDRKPCGLLETSQRLYRNELGWRRGEPRTGKRQKSIHSMDSMQPGSKHEIHRAHASAPLEVREHVFVQGYEQSHRHTTRFFKGKYLSTVKGWDSSLTKNNGHHSNPPFFLSGFRCTMISMEIPPKSKRVLHHKGPCKSRGLWTVKDG